MIEPSKSCWPLVETVAYTKPWRPCGSVAVLELLMGVKIVLRPVWSARKRDAPFALDASKESEICWPAEYLPVTVSLGKDVKGSVGFEDGQDLMKGDASEMTSLPSRGTSKAPDQGDMDCVIALSQAAWRASVERIEPAAVRAEGLEPRYCAPPRYAESPTFSRMMANCTKDWTSVIGLGGHKYQCVLSKKEGGRLTMSTRRAWGRRCRARWSGT